MAKSEEEANQPLEKMDRYLKNIQKHTCVLSYTKKGVCTTKTKRWDVIRKLAKKVATEDETPGGRTIKEPQDFDPGVQLLPRQDFMIYGTIPTMEQREILKCKNCGKVFYPQDIQNHKNCSRRPHTLPNVMKKKLKTKPNGSSSSNGKKPSSNGDSPHSSSTNSSSPTPQSIVSSVVVCPVKGVKDFEFKRPYTPPPLKPAVHRPPGSPSPSMPQLKVSVKKIGSTKVFKTSPLIVSAPSEITSSQKPDSKLSPSKVVTSLKTASASKVISPSVSSHHSSSSKSSSSSGGHSSSKSSSTGNISRSSSSSSSSSSYHGSKSSSSSSHHSPKSLSSSSLSSSHHRSRSPSSPGHHSPKLPSSKSSSSGSSHHGSSHHRSSSSSSSSSSHHSSKSSSSSSSSRSSSSNSATSKSTPMDTLPPSSSLSSSSHHYHSSNSSSSHSSSRHKKASSSGSSKRSISSSSSGSGGSMISTYSSNKNLPRNFHPDTHCGVVEGGKGPCMRTITCSNHRLHLRKQVSGRSKDIHQLIAERRAAKENEMRAAFLLSTSQPALVQPVPNAGSKNYVPNLATGCVPTVAPVASIPDTIKLEHHFEPPFPPEEFVYPPGLENTADIMQKLVTAGVDLGLSDEKKFQLTMHSVKGALNNMPIMVVPVRPLSGICEVIKIGKNVLSVESKKPTYPPAKKAAVMPITSNYSNSSHVRIYKTHPKPLRFANFGTRKLGGAVVCANPLLEDQKNDMLSKIDFALESNILKDSSEKKSSDLNGFVTHIDASDETDIPAPVHPVENGRIPEPTPQPQPVAIRRIMSRHELIIRLIDRFGF